MPLLLAWLSLLCGFAGPHRPEARPATHSAQGTQLTLDTARYLPAPFRVVAEDLVLEVQQGVGLAAFAGSRPTALVLVGRGTMRFSPPIRSEQRQLQLLSGTPTLAVEFDSAYVRLHPDLFESHVMPSAFREGGPAGDLPRRARAIFDDQVGRSFSQEVLQGHGPSRRIAALPGKEEFLAEVHTRRFGGLSYLRLPSEPEDVVLLDHDRGRTLVAYPSGGHRAAAGFAYGDEYGLPYEVSHYDIDASLDPGRLALIGRTRLRLRALEALETVRLRLDRGLIVSAVRSADQGAHEFLQQPESATLLVRLVPPLGAGREITLEVSYAGTVVPQTLLPGSKPGEGAELSGLIGGPAVVPSRPLRDGLANRRDAASLLYSNRVYWFPQSPVRNHTTVVLRVDVPPGFLALASAPPDGPAATGPSGQRTFTFRTDRPVRYVALLVGRLLPLGEPASPAPPLVHGVSSQQLAERARAAVRDATDMVRFFSTLAGDLPFPPLTLALVEGPGPAAHSPAYLAILGEPLGWNPASAGDDPAYYAGEPEFFLAHEIAHQWWGQAVGWRNYREQWLSEAFAQYLGALYIGHRHGEEAFAQVLAWMNRWATGVVQQGPVSLGIRAGQVTGRREQFIAIVYNRGACALHMLRRWLGDEVFFHGVRAYFERWKFRRAGTDDFRRALEEASGRDLGRFFDEWIRDDGEPDVHWSAAVSPSEGRERLHLRLDQMGGTFDLPLQVRIGPRTIPRPSRTCARRLPARSTTSTWTVR